MKTLWIVERGLQYAICKMQLCNMQNAKCNMQNAKCNFAAGIGDSIALLPHHYQQQVLCVWISFYSSITNKRISKVNICSRKSKVKSKEILSTPATNPSRKQIPHHFHSKLAILQEHLDKMSQARTRISIRGEGVLQVEHQTTISSPPLDHWLHQDGTRYSRQLSVVETLETNGTTKETSEETIKIGEEQVAIFLTY